MSLSKRTCAKCEARLARSNKSGLCRQHWGKPNPALLMSILVEAVESGSWCPSNVTLQRLLGCSEKTVSNMLRDLEEQGKATVYSTRGKRVAIVAGVGTSRKPEDVAPRFDSKAGPDVSVAQRIEQYVCPRTGVRITAPVVLKTQGFTPWGARL